MKKRNLIVSILLILSAVILSSCGGTENDENILRVGMEANYAPFNWSQSDNSNGAVEIEKSKKLLRV